MCMWKNCCNVLGLYENNEKEENISSKSNVSDTLRSIGLESRKGEKCLHAIKNALDLILLAILGNKREVYGNSFRAELANEG